MLKRHIYISQKAFNKLSDSMHMADNRYEVGGVLLGHKQWHTFYIIELTILNNLDNESNISFVLDGNGHMKEIIEIRKNFIFPPSVIGIWHSHIIEIDSFSVQDRKSNKILTEQIRGALSIIALQNECSGIIRLCPYYISKNNSESMCIISIDKQNICIPSRFIRRRKNDE